MSEKELLDRIDELEKRFSELMGDLKAAVKEFETYKRITENELAEAKEELPTDTKQSRKNRINLFYIGFWLVKREFNRAYEWFMGENRKGYLEGECDTLSFFAYLYLVAYKKDWFDKRYKDRNKRTFAAYMRDGAFAHLEMNYSDRNFSNRLKPIMDSCKHLLGKNVELTKDNCKDRFARNFRKIYELIE